MTIGASCAVNRPPGFPLLLGEIGFFQATESDVCAVDLNMNKYFNNFKVNDKSMFT